MGGKYRLIRLVTWKLSSGSKELQDVEIKDIVRERQPSNYLQKSRMTDQSKCLPNQLPEQGCRRCQTLWCLVILANPTTEAAQDRDRYPPSAGYGQE
ncbi:hypothetical protein HL42_0389 [Trichophyton rubrum]|nr:hypothetical protein HL42_0389 [Trichophyton rubrum]